jgi:two-component system OmpR family response regulator
MAYLMLVDDDEDFARAAATALEHAGHDVTIHLDTEGAASAMRERPPDLLVLDVMFPEDASGGFTFARTIRREEPDLAHVPVLLLTAINTQFPLGFGSTDIDDVWLPVDDFLEKPVDLDQLVAKVSAMLGEAA